MQGWFVSLFSLLNNHIMSFESSYLTVFQFQQIWQPSSFWCIVFNRYCWVWFLSCLKLPQFYFWLIRTYPVFWFSHFYMAFTFLITSLSQIVRHTGFFSHWALFSILLISTINFIPSSSIQNRFFKSSLPIAPILPLNCFFTFPLIWLSVLLRF